MIGIKMSNCKFDVDESNQTVICTISNTEELLLDFIKDNFSTGKFNLSNAINEKLKKKLTMPSEYKGKAVCAPEDEWDEETGKLIAFYRAKDKCYVSFFKRATTLMNEFDQHFEDTVEGFNSFGLILAKNKERLANKIEMRIK